MTNDRVRHGNPALRPDQALDDLYDLMNDQSIKLQDRIYAARSASRVEPLGLLGDEPPAVVFLRNIITFRAHGKPYSAIFRHQAAAALAYWERRAKQAAIKFAVTDTTENTNAWRRILNGISRYSLVKNGRWPDDRHTLIGQNQQFTMPQHEPELALNAIFMIGKNTKKRRAKAIDEPDKPVITSEQQRQDILADVAKLTPRLALATLQAIAHTAAIPDTPPHTAERLVRPLPND